VAAMVAWAAYALLQKKWPSPLGATARLACICIGGVLVLTPFALWEWLQTDRPAWSPAATGLVLAAGLVPGLCAYWAYGFAQKVLGASRVAASLYLGPLYGGLTAWGGAGRAHGLAPPGRRLSDFAGHLAGFAPEPVTMKKATRGWP